MDTPKPKRRCNTVEESKPRSVNETGYDERPAKYMANPLKGFWQAVREFFAI